MNFKAQIAPKGLQFNSSDFHISDKYATILTVISYPRYIGEGYLSDVTNIPGVKMVIKHIPVPFSILSKMLNKELADKIFPNVTSDILYLTLSSRVVINLEPDAPKTLLDISLTIL